MNKRILSMILIVGLCLLALPAQALAEEPYILALGDSITAGHGLTAPASESFVGRLGSIAGEKTINAARNGATSGDLAALAAGGDLDEEIAGAEAITITIGGNDLMDVFYELTAERCNRGRGDESKITAAEAEQALTRRGDARRSAVELAAGLVILDGYDGVQNRFAEAAERVKQNLAQVAGYIRAKNPGADIFVASQYNPYKNIVISSIVDIDAGGFMARGTEELNDAVSAGAADGGYAVADVGGAFEASEEKLCNASAAPINLDFHPNAAGHEKIAEVFASAMIEKKGIWELFTAEGTEADDPDAAATRAMMFAALAKLDGQSAAGGEKWYSAAQGWVKRAGVSDGTEPESGVTREQLAVMLYQYAKRSGIAVSAAAGPADERADYPFDGEGGAALKEGNGLSRFSDGGSVSPWAAQSVDWAVKSGVLTPKTDGSLAPGEGVTRMEAAFILKHFLALKPLGK